jgi:ABC-type lipoprotein export system ATPase subunit
MKPWVQHKELQIINKRMLAIKNISKSFLQRGLVLDNLSLDVNEGDTISIMGPSGSGKTTLMNIIGLLDKPDSGNIFFRGNDILNYSDDESAEYRNRNVGFVFQEHLLLEHLTIMENIFLPLLAIRHTREETEKSEQHAAALMKKTGISGIASKYPSQISGGEAQRAALVRALINKPSILLADEPTGSLDAKNAEIMGDMLVEINKDLGITLILATHSEKLARKMTRNMILDTGKLC